MLLLPFCRVNNGTALEKLNKYKQTQKSVNLFTKSLKDTTQIEM